MELKTTKHNQINTSAYIWLLISIILHTTAIIIIKMVVMAEAPHGNLISIQFFVNAVTNVLLWVGVFCFFSGMFFWTRALTHLDLSLAYPTSSISYIINLILSYYVFDEPITVGRIMGIFLIIIGVIFMYKPQKKMES